MSALPSWRQASLDIARKLAWRAGIGAVIVGAAAVALSPVAPLPPSDIPILGSMLMLSSIPVFLLSASLALDAYLFLMLAAYPDEATGGAAVDAFLARLWLRRMASETRPLADRIAGTKRLISKQNVAFFVCMACLLLVFFANFA